MLKQTVYDVYAKLHILKSELPPTKCVDPPLILLEVCMTYFSKKNIEAAKHSEIMSTYRNLRETKLQFTDAALAIVRTGLS